MANYTSLDDLGDDPGTGLVLTELVSARFPWGTPLSLRVGPGETVAMLGPAGTGKTALLRGIVGLDSITRGRISVRDQDVTDQPVGRRRIGFVSARPGDGHPAFARVHETIARSTPWEGAPGWRIASLLAESDLFEGEIEDLMSAFPSMLAPIDQFRVALARNLFRRPGALLLDAILDRLEGDGARLQGIRLVRRIARRGLPVLLATTDSTLAAALADRVVVLDVRGPLEVGAPADLRGFPSTRRVLEIISGGEVAFLPVRVGSGDDVVTHRDGVPLGTGVPGASLQPGQPLSVGLDARDLILGPAGRVPLRGSVESVESLPGARNARVFLRCEDSDVVASVPSALTPRVGDHVGIQSIGTPWLFHGAMGTPVGRLVSYGVDQIGRLERHRGVCLRATMTA